MTSESDRAWDESLTLRTNLAKDMQVLEKQLESLSLLLWGQGAPSKVQIQNLQSLGLCTQTIHQLLNLLRSEGDTKSDELAKLRDLRRQLELA